LGARRADLATTLSTNTWKVSNALTLIYRMAVALITFAVFVAFMTVISVPLTLVAMLSLAAAVLVIRFSTQKADSVGRAVVEENKRFGQRIWESMDSLQLIRAFGREEYELKRFDQASDSVRRRLNALDMLWALPAPISEVAITLMIGALVLVASSVGVGIAALAAFLSLLYRLQGPTRELMQSKVALDGMLAAIADVATLLAQSSRPLLTDGVRPAKPPRSAISLRDVWFRYGPDEPWALQGASFDIPVGATTAIVGESGAGKSSVLLLLFRFQDPTAGTLVCDGVPLTDLRVDDWRARLALMSQDVQLFHDTITANIAYGREGASPEDIRAAATIARADRFIEALPAGYETVVGDQGVRLSGGERQRIALARTVLRDPDVLFLDEATNALDVESEQAFQLALERYAHSRTVVVVAHRLSTVRNADQVVVMSKGCVVEVGPPDRLLRDRGHFARMYNLQHGAFSENRAVSP
jgi:ATP-binding cassette, subfamily B, bacterial MsbA